MLASNFPPVIDIADNREYTMDNNEHTDTSHENNEDFISDIASHIQEIGTKTTTQISVSPMVLENPTYAKK